MLKNLVLIYVGITILAVIAVFLGYRIYQKQTEVALPPSKNIQTQDIPSPKGSVDKVTSVSNLESNERQEVLNFPSSNASAEEKKKHSDLVNKLGNQSGATTLNISGCNPTPIVSRVKQGSSFKIENPDQLDHTIYANPAKKIVIKGNSESTLSTSDFGSSLGDYGYNCDTSTTPVGIIQIVP